jgi:eukaryotic-like serine/threonine-protein kinase
MIGETILHYKILEKLGEGGMGEVYKAQDTKLDRFVALKFLPSQLTASEEDKARFIQEAKAASAMNHPNVCTIHSIEEYNNQLFIVMEFVEGKSLRSVVETHSDASLPTKQILEIGIQVAEGLAAAHEKGIVHRDIKPENIMIRKDGIAQIMDFGLAKLYSDKNASRLTKVGTTMGTLGYMSPEQIQGLDVDHRTDIFSFGILLYEMFAGESPFKGMHETAIMYEIVNVDAPPLSTIKEGIDPELDEIILECLEKDKDDRYQSAKELAKDLRKIKKSTGHRKSRVYNVNSNVNSTASGRTQLSKSSGSITIEAFNKRFELKNIVNLLLIISTFAAAVFAYLYFNKSIVSIKRLIQFNVLPPKGVSFEAQSPAISPDGKTIAFMATDSTSKSMIFLRPLESVEIKPLQGTENASYPFWSFDSKSLGFFANGKLNTINLSTGTIKVLCDVEEGFCANWGENNVILYTSSFFSPLYKINADGGVTSELTRLDNSLSEERHFNGQMLPDNHHFIYSAFSRNADESAYYVGSLDNDARIRILTINGGDFTEKARFVSPDLLLFRKNNSLMVQKFDISNFRLQNEPQLVMNDVNDFSVSNEVLVTSQNISSLKSELILYNRQGKKLKTIDSLGFFIEISMSPDENQIAYHRILGPDRDESFNQDIWIYDRIRNISTRLTTEPAADVMPLWSPDGKYIAYASSPDSIYDLYEKNLASSGKPILLLKTNFNKDPKDWSSDGKYILFESQGNLWALPMFGDHKPFLYLSNGFNIPGASFSPDARWVAYSSNQSGKYQIYIQSFPEPKEQYQVSTNGGSSPQWRKDGKELFYISSSNKLMAVEIRTEPQVHIGSIVPLLDTDFFEGWSNMYKVLNNGQEFLANTGSTSSILKPLKVVVNWKNLINEK